MSTNALNCPVKLKLCKYFYWICRTSWINLLPTCLDDWVQVKFLNFFKTYKTHVTLRKYFSTSFIDIMHHAGAVMKIPTAHISFGLIKFYQTIFRLPKNPNTTTIDRCFMWVDMRYSRYIIYVNLIFKFSVLISNGISA